MGAAGDISNLTFTTTKQGNSRSRQTYKSIKRLSVAISRLRAPVVLGKAATSLMDRPT